MGQTGDLRWWLRHALIFAALVVNLWLMGDVVEGWFGHGVRTIFEIGLILGYMTLVAGMSAPLPWRHRTEGDEQSRDS